MTEKRILLFLVGVIVILVIITIYEVLTQEERETIYIERMNQYNELDECIGFVHSPCPYYVLNKKLDRILEILEGKE